MKQTDKPPLHIGFMPLTDSAPIVMAKELGFFEKHGLNVHLHAQNSWSTLRDKLHAGILDAAQMLAPMPIASTLGLHGTQVKITVPIVLSLNGNAITLSNSLCQEILDANSISILPIPMSAALLKNVLEKRRAKQAPKLRLATVYPYSCHFYQLHTWLACGNISIDDVDISIVPPVSMVDAMHCGDIDGYCVGGPWNAKAVRAGFGVTVICSSDINGLEIEKVVGITSAFCEKHTDTVIKMCAAIKQSCEWLSSGPNRFEAARILSSYEYLDAPLDVVAPSLLGSCLVSSTRAPRYIPQYNLFGNAQHDINAPTLQYQDALLTHMLAAKHIDKSKVDSLNIETIFREDLYTQALKLCTDALP